MIYYTENQIDDLRDVIAAKDAEIARLREALSKIAAYPRERSDEMGVAVLRQLSRDALAPVSEVSK